MAFISPVRTDANGVERKTGNLQTLGKDDFLQLLVTKLQYQDPLKPMEDQDFIAQLAQFSSLEQMNNISDGIATSNQWDFLQMQSLNNVMASGLIGKDVKATYNGIYVDQESTPKINYTLNSPADEVKLVIKDAQGAIVTTLSQDNVSPGNNSINWDGTDNLGNKVADGYYTVSATATDSSGSTFTPSL
ncbi:MAG: flagellar hook assembly protein FlgD, partial [Candidatus Zixiibacteriota bacterium]